MIATPLRLVFRGFPLAALSVLLFAGCASDDAPKHRRGAAMKPITPLAGHETFFDGAVLAELNLNSSPNFEFSGSHRDGDRPSGSGGGGGGGGMRHRRGGGGGMGGGGMGGPRGGMEGEPGEMPERGSRMGGGMGAPSGPPVMVHLRLTNHGAARAEVRITDFLSPVGNFVVEPEKFSLEAGQSLEAEPMTSRIAGEIPETTVTLTLKTGGKTEQKTITLKPAPGSVPPPPADAPPAG